jgi:hypothetical protein
MTDAANQVETEYTYTIESEAEGGETETVTSTMLVQKVCVAELNSDFVKEKSFDIPEFVTAKEYHPSASTDFVTEPPYRHVSNDSTYGLPDAYECK